MGDLIVRPSYQLGPRDILTVEKINLMATPVVELALEDPVNDQNFFRNGNFYSSFWQNPAGVTCPDGVDTANADYWICTPDKGTVQYLRSDQVPDLFSLWSVELQGSPNLDTVTFGQQIIGDLAATLRRKCTFSGYIQNLTGLTASPLLNIYTCNSFNNFNDTTLQMTLNLQTIQNGEWGYESATMDLTAVPNVANGLGVALFFGQGGMGSAVKLVRLSRLKFQIGEIATEFVDDTSLFVETPTIDASMLQDGCIARPSLFQPNVIPVGTYQAKSIKNGDIDDKAIDGRTLSDTAISDKLGYTPVNKGGDTAIGVLQHTVDTVVGADAAQGASVVAQLSDANKANDGYFPAIGLVRDPAGTRRSIGLTLDNRLKTVDATGKVGYIQDSIIGIPTEAYQDKSITLEKLADALVNLIIPPGIMEFFGGPTPPTGWLVCDGRAVKRDDYPKLFAAIGTYWGAGDNLTTFGLPDMRGRVPLGYVNTPVAGITARAFAAKGGEEGHVLSTAELASHAHGVSDPQHAHGISDPTHTHPISIRQRTDVAIGGSSAALNTITGGFVGVTTQGAATLEQVLAGPTGIAIQAAGGNGAHNNMQPFSVGYWIVKT